MESTYRQVLVQKNEETEQSFIECVAEVFSTIMEENVSTQKAAAILNIILAVMLVIFPVCMPVAIRIIALAWLGVSFWWCKDAGILDEED